ncbi:hypothetical protein [Enterococcus sp. DIV0187]|uniref:hypothetical protein n=1 Tax=Enterococcus sp. DIV0187 TaxID=2774644 RepID=UPI003F288083
MDILKKNVVVVLDEYEDGAVYTTLEINWDGCQKWVNDHSHNGCMPIPSRRWMSKKALEKAKEIRSYRNRDFYESKEQLAQLEQIPPVFRSLNYY